MMHAIIDTDGTRLVYWGIGETEEAARCDAEEQEGYEETEHNATAEISDMLAREIDRGAIVVVS